MPVTFDVVLHLVQGVVGVHIFCKKMSLAVLQNDAPASV